jgi:hypothetical protein
VLGVPVKAMELLAQMPVRRVEESKRHDVRGGDCADSGGGSTDGAEISSQLGLVEPQIPLISQMDQSLGPTGESTYPGSQWRICEIRGSKQRGSFD